MNWKAEALLEQALTAVRNRAYDQALALLTAAIGEQADLVEAYVLRGNILVSQERWFDALLHYNCAIASRPEAADAHNNRGTCLAHLGRWQEAEEAFRRSIEIRAARDPYMGLASMYCTLMRLDDAADAYRAACVFDPNDAEAEFNLGVTELGLGRWQSGFRHYAARFDNDPFPPAARRFPQWRGEDLKNKTLLLYPEQGYGDEIMAARFAAYLDEALPYTRVVLEARGPFERLARSVGDLVDVIPRGELLPATIDYACPALDVPMVLGLSPLEVPRPVSYLRSPSSKRWTEWLARLPAGLNVGLCWASGRHLSTALGARAMKSIPLATLAPLLETSGINWISLQKPRELRAPTDCVFFDATDEIHDLADTAALISALDLVVSVDTAVAHLAGALGKPVWNFVRYSGYWPWLAPSVAPDPSYSIWYPSMRLYRQPALHDWATPVARAAADLKDIIVRKQEEKAA